MWKGKKVSVVFSTYNEKDTIRMFINELFKTGYVDEVIAVDNNSVKGTKAEILKTKARYFLETRQGFGYGYMRALKESSGDIIIMSEPDGTFLANDILKLLSYSDDFEVVLGTRTTNSLIGEGANMGLLMKWANWFYAKMVEFGFNTTHLTDVGCTYRLIKREAYERIKNKLIINGNEFNLDMTLQVVRNKISFIEIPVSYKKRIGESSVTGSRVKAARVALKMLILMIKHRFNLIKK